MDLLREAIGPLGSNCFSRGGGSVPEFVRKPIITCDFLGAADPLPHPHLRILPWFAYNKIRVANDDAQNHRIEISFVPKSYFVICKIKNIGVS